MQHTVLLYCEAIHIKCDLVYVIKMEAAKVIVFLFRLFGITAKITLSQNKDQFLGRQQ
jgi:hypothetical protein